MVNVRLIVKAGLLLISLTLVSGSPTPGVTPIVFLGLGEAVSYRFINVICGVFNGLKLVGGALASLILVSSGVKWIGEADDPAARKLAKDYIKWCIMGLIIILLSDALVGYIAQSPGVIESCSWWCTHVLSPSDC